MPLGRHKCCVPDCGKTRLDNTKLHRFPNPNKDLDRFHTWIHVIGGDILALDNDYIHKNVRICHNHFEPQYYTWTGRVSANSTPTLHLSDVHLQDHYYARKNHHDHTYSKLEDPPESSPVVFVSLMKAFN